MYLFIIVMCTYFTFHSYFQIHYSNRVPSPIGVIMSLEIKAIDIIICDIGKMVNIKLCLCVFLLNYSTAPVSMTEIKRLP